MDHFDRLVGRARGEGTLASPSVPSLYEPHSSIEGWIEEVSNEVEPEAPARVAPRAREIGARMEHVSVRTPRSATTAAAPPVSRPSSSVEVEDHARVEVPHRNDAQVAIVEPPVVAPSVRSAPPASPARVSGGVTRVSRLVDRPRTPSSSFVSTPPRADARPGQRTASTAGARVDTQQRRGHSASPPESEAAVPAGGVSAIEPRPGAASSSSDDLEHEQIVAPTIAAGQRARLAEPSLRSTSIAASAHEPPRSRHTADAAVESPSQQQDTVVHVTIGRIDVHAPPQAAREPQRSKRDPDRGVLSLAEIAKRRGGSA
jgi:hypothetical protein